MNTPLERWHELVASRDAGGLEALLAEDAVFYSPVVHTAQRGRAVTAAYLRAALAVLGVPGFCYVREIIGETDAMLEFELELDGVYVNGVDLIRWNGDGQIVEFKVMLRPLQAIEVVRERMAASLAARKR